MCVRSREHNVPRIEVLEDRQKALASPLAAPANLMAVSDLVDYAVANRVRRTSGNSGIGRFRQANYCKSRKWLQYFHALVGVILANFTFCIESSPGALLPNISGNHRARAESLSGLDASMSFAVFQRSGTTGDVYGTGQLDFDNSFFRGSNSPLFDTAAEYLYLYQYVNDGAGTDTFTSLSMLAPQITSWGAWNTQLALADNGGVVTVNNPFGTNTASFQTASPATLGVSGGYVRSMANTIPLTSLSYSSGIVRGNFSLAPGNTLSLWGFTSNQPPHLVAVTPTICNDSLACGSYVAPRLPGDYNLDGRVDAADYVVWRKNDGTKAGFDRWRANFGLSFYAGSGSVANDFGGTPPAAVPEPASLLLFAIAVCTGAAVRRR